jgi:hypothetical protein
LFNVACFGDVAAERPRLSKGDRVYCEVWLSLSRRKGLYGREAPLSLVATKILVFDQTDRHRRPIPKMEATHARLKAYPPDNGHPQVVEGLDAVRLLERLREKLGFIGPNEPVKVKSGPENTAAVSRNTQERDRLAPDDVMFPF